MKKATGTELARTDDGWLCPGCGRPFKNFYGPKERLRCLDCWVTEHPDDPYTHRNRHGVQPGLVDEKARCNCGKALSDPLSIEMATMK